MVTHLAHRLPWASLSDVVKYRCTLTKGKQVITIDSETKQKHEKDIAHFARRLVDAIKEFAASDASPLDEREPYNDSQWGATEYNPGAWGSSMVWCSGTLRSI